MPTEFIGSNVVLVANHFNPSIFSQIWLVKNGLISEDEFGEGCLFSENVAKVESHLYGLLVMPPQLQFVPRGKPEENGRLVSEKVSRIVELLPQTPYTALGLNFQWHVWPTHGDVRQLARRLFFQDPHPLFSHFSSGDANFGGYMSRDVLGGRLKLDVKPLVVERIEKETNESSKYERLLCAFNFHLDCSDVDTVIDKLKGHLNRWDEAYSRASTIVGDVESWESQDAE